MRLDEEVGYVRETLPGDAEWVGRLEVAGREHQVTVASGHLVFATGYFESPNPLRVPGEGLPHVSHFFVEPHPHWQQRVVVVGGGKNAVDAALGRYRGIALVT